MTYTRIGFVLAALFTAGLTAVAVAQIEENGSGSAAVFLLALAAMAMVGMIALGTVVGGRGGPREFPTASLDGEGVAPGEAAAPPPAAEAAPSGSGEEAPG